MSGKHIPDPGFGGDAGDADARLAEALTAYAEEPAREPDVLHALAFARVLVPVIAVLAEEEPVAAGDLRREKSTDMALVTLVGRDGRRALPVFTSLATLADWDPRARPVPVEASRAALSAAAEGAAALVVDIAGPRSYVLTGRGLRRLAESDPCLPAYADQRVADELARLCAKHPEIGTAWLVPAAGLDARVALQVTGEPAAASAAAHSVAVGVRESDVLRAALLRGIDLAVLPAGADPGGEPLYRRSPSRGPGPR